MKNQPRGKRRDRRSGQSPYARHGKREIVYSTEHREWKRAHDARTSGKAAPAADKANRRAAA